MKRRPPNPMTGTDEATEEAFSGQQAPPPTPYVRAAPDPYETGAANTPFEYSGMPQVAAMPITPPAAVDSQAAEYQRAGTGFRRPEVSMAPTPALSTYSENAGKAQAVGKATPTKEEYVRAHEPKGVGGRVLSVVRSMGKALRDQGIMGAMYGGVNAAVDKNYEASRDYTTHVEPESYTRQANLYGLAGKEIGLENTIEDNARARQQMEMNQEYHRDVLDNNRFNRQQSQYNSDRNYELSYGGHVLQVQKFIQEMKDKADKAKDAHEKESFERQYKAAELYLKSGIPMPAEVAKGMGAPGLTGALAREPNTPFDVDKAGVGPEAYGRKDWNDLIDNPDYQVAYQSALKAAGSEKELNASIKYGDIKLPPKQIPLYEYAQKNPHPLNAAAAKKRGTGASAGGGRGAAARHGRLQPGDTVHIMQNGKKTAVKVGKVYGDGTWDPE